ncbi:unnamed protein product, partial [Thlaspi arvense]
MAVTRQTTRSAYEYVHAVKTTFKDNRDKYVTFVKVMKDFKTNRISTNCVRSRVNDLFKGHPKLILGLNKFLPRGYEVTSESDRTPLKTLEFGEALAFVEKVHARLSEDGFKYFLKIIQMHRQDKKSVTEVYYEVFDVLFRDQHDLRWLALGLPSQTLFPRQSPLSQDESILPLLHFYPPFPLSLSSIDLVVTHPPPLGLRPPLDLSLGKSPSVLFEVLSPLALPEPSDPPDSPSILTPHLVLVASAISSPDLDFSFLNLVVAFSVVYVVSSRVMFFVLRRTLPAVCIPEILPSLHLSIPYVASPFHRPAASLSLPPPQVCSYSSTSASSILEQSLAGWEVLVVWSLDMLAPLPNVLVSFVSASVRLFTVVYKVCPVVKLTEASSFLSKGQNKKACLNPISLNRVLDFYSPHLSFKEVVFLPNILFALSGIVSWSIVSKVVRFRIKVVRISVSSSIIDVADSFTFSTIDALIPPLGGFVQDSIVYSCLDVTLVELY